VVPELTGGPVVTTSETTANPETKTRTAALSVFSNSGLILLKVIAGTVTGSVDSSIDHVASIVAFLSVRKAVEPADESHRYGHEKIENLSAAILYTGLGLLARSSRELTDHSLPDEEVELIRASIEEFGPRGVVGYHELRTLRAGARRYVDLHGHVPLRNLARGCPPDRP